MQRGAGPRLLLAQRLQGRRRDRLSARRLGLRARAFGDLAHIGFQPPPRLDEFVFAFAPGNVQRQSLVAADVGGEPL